MEIENVTVRTSQDLFGVLKTVGATDMSMSLKRVLQYLKMYIYSLKLYDEKNPNYVSCNEDLTKVFGVKQFAATDIMKLLIPNLLIQEKKKDEDNRTFLLRVLKRKNDDLSSQIPKKNCIEDNLELGKNGYEKKNAIISEEDDSAWSDSSVETYWSEREETDDVSDAFSVEYEVASVESDNFSDSETSSVEDILEATILTVYSDDEDFWADRSCEDSGSDSEIGDDKWQCSKCGTFTKPPTRYCQGCWELRMGWLPDRQHPPRRRKQKRTRSSSVPATTERLQHLQEDEVVPALVATSSDPGKTEDSSNLCCLCYEKPRTSSFIHGNIGHLVACYKCAVKLYDRKEPCPVCRRHIQKVIKNFS